MLRKLVLSVSFCLLSLSASFAQDRSTPEATVRSFLSAFSQADIKLAAKCVKGVTMSVATQEEVAKDIKKNPASFTLNNVKVIMNGANATLTADGSMKPINAESGLTFLTSVDLVLADGSWLIVPDPSKAQQERPDMVNALGYILTEPNVLTRANAAAASSTCLSNVRQVDVATFMFLQDHSETFKFKATTYRTSLLPYVKNESIFKCPLDTAKGTSYSVNANLVGVYIGKLSAPAETVMMYEGKNGKLDFRHNGKAAIGFADGHVKLVDAQEAKKLRWKP